MVDYYKMAFKKYAQFEGRSTRSEYWWFVLCNALVVMLFYVFIGLGAVAEVGVLAVVGGLGVFAYSLASFLPGLAVSVRRMHDVGKSGWFLLIGLIPLVGLIILYFLAQESDPNSNMYGPVPGGKADSLQDSFVDFDKRDLV